MAIPAVPAISSMLSVWFTISKPLTSRVWPRAVTRNSCMAARAKSASRRPCENSLTVDMFVYASVMRPVIMDRASACAAAMVPRRGTKYTSATPYPAIQPRNGTSSHQSNPATTAATVMK